MKKCILVIGAKGSNYKDIAENIAKQNKMTILHKDVISDLINSNLNISNNVSIKLQHKSFDILSYFFNEYAKQKSNIIITINNNENEINDFINICNENKYKLLIINLGKYDLNISEDINYLKINEKEFYNESIYDKTIKKFLYFDSCIRIEYSSMAVIICEDEILVTYERIYDNTAISLPKGHIEKGENKIDAAIREAKEEAGIILYQSDYVKSLEPYATHFITPRDTEIVKIVYPILFKINEKRSINPTEERINKVVYMKIDDFINESTYINVGQMVKKLI